MPRGGARVGAGRPARKVSAEACVQVRLKAWRQAGALAAGAAGSWRWGAGASVDYSTTTDAVTLRFQLNGAAQIQRLVLLRTASTGCALGGLRTRVACPFCARPAQVLHLRLAPHATTGFGCRICQQIAPASQRENAVERAHRRLDKALAKLGPDGSKPPAMRAATFERLLRDIADRRLEARGVFIAGLRALLEPA